MSVSLISIKCPECGAELQVEEGRDKYFCSYCGTKVILTNENEHIYRHINEAELKKAETDRMVKMRQLDMQEKWNMPNKTLVIIWLAATGFLTLVGIFGALIHNEVLEFCLGGAALVGLWGGLFLVLKHDEDERKNKRVVAGPNEIAITGAMVEGEWGNYKAAELLFKSAGFTNITTIPLNDLSPRNIKKEGQVKLVTINGNEDYSEDDVFSKNASILITYHSVKA